MIDSPFPQTGVGAILKTYRLKVSPRQRDYRWREHHVKTLLEDLAKALDSDDQEYFLGTIVTIPDADGALDIIDGQQRLATLSILLSRIRAFLLSTEGGIAKSIESFLSEYDRHQRSDVNKLKLNLTDNDFFGKWLLSPQVPPLLPESAPLSHKRLRAAFVTAAEYITRIVAPESPKNYGDKLNRWIDFIEKKATVILFRVPSRGNAYKMFETLNDRGLRTTQADLVKNYLFSRAGDREGEAMHSWAQMVGALSSLQADDVDIDDDKDDITVVFLRCALMCISGFLRKNAVYERVQAEARGPQTAISHLAQLESLAKTYECTFYQDHEFWKPYPDSARHAVQTINDFDIKPFRSALVAVAAKFDAREATRAFQFFASLGVRMLIATSTRTGSVEETMAKAANAVFKEEIKSTAKLKEAVADITPSDPVFSAAFEAATLSKGPLARYYLRSLERVVQKATHPWFVPNEDRDAMTLEHVLPEKPEGNWPQFNEEEHAAYWRRIGNLCLLPKGVNSDLRSADEKTKFAVYKDTPYELTRHIPDAPHWTKETICERQKGLAKLALKAWPL
jgi:Protein of unknown function DUF262/Protein of unknown function (DUF1524)